MTLRQTMLVILLPLLGVIAFFTWTDWTTMTARVTALDQQIDGLAKAEIIGNAVHELQKERGYSAGYTSSGGANFAEALPRQRAETDTVLTALVASMQALRSAEGVDVAAIDAALADLADWRTAITATQKTVPELAGYYTGLINTLIHAANIITHAGQDAQLAQLIEARNLIGAAKESAGLERATGAAGIGAGAFPPALHARLISLGAVQFSDLRLAAEIIERPILLDDITGAPAAQTLSAMRQTLVDSGYTGVMGDFTAPDWFAAATAWIDLLRDTETALTAEITLRAQTDRDSAAQAMRTTLGIIGVIVALATALSVLVFERMTRRITGMIRLMGAYRDGDFDPEVPQLAPRSELGRMAHVLADFKDAMRDRQNASARTKAEDEARLNAIHQQVVDMMSDGLQALAQADLTRRFDTPLDPRYDHIRKNFNTATERLHGVISALAGAVADIAERAGHMDRDTEQLAARTLQQGDTVATSASGVNRVTDETRADLDQIDDAQSEARTAAATAAESDKTVHTAIAAMDQISARSNEIAKIVTVIEELAFQTNLLALNARVEAARAGDSGRGFAVVAEEVRELAGRSTKSALDIKKLISESHREVQDGVQLVNSAGHSLQSMIASVQSMDTTLSNIARSARGHAEDLSEIDRAMKLLQDLNTANTAMVRDSRATSTEITRTATHLADLVADFRLGTASGSLTEIPTGKPRAA